MPRYNKKPFQNEIFNRHEEEIRSLLQALELRNQHSEVENRVLVDMYETEGALVIEFDLPGFELSDISIAIRGTSILLDARRPCPQPAENSRFICVERNHGIFHHALPLPCNVDSEKIHAEYRRGVLRIFCPKIKEIQIPIKEILS